MLSTLDSWDVPALRHERSIRHTMRGLRAGRWREVLLDAERVQHFYRSVRVGDQTTQRTEIRTLVEILNYVRLAIEMHSAILTDQAMRLTMPDEAADQAAWLDRVRQRSMWDRLIAEAVAVCWTEGRAMLSLRVTSAGVAIELQDNDRVIPVGPVLDPEHGGPAVYERRWVVERDDPSDRRKKRRYLRVERHSAPGGAGTIEQEAYQTESLDALQELATLTRVPLAEAIGDELAGQTPERRATGLPHPMIVMLVRSQSYGRPEMILPEDEVTTVEQTMAALTQMSRAASIHLSPRMLVPSARMFDSSGAVEQAQEILIDDSMQAKYMEQSFNFQAALRRFEMSLANGLASCQMSPALLGLRLSEGGGVPPTATQMRLNSTVTLSAASKAQGYIEPALARLWWLVSLLERQLPGRLYTPVRPDVELRPAIPTDPHDRAIELAERVDRQLISRQAALVELYGPAAGAAMYERIQAEQESAARAASARMGAELGLTSSASVDAPDAPAPEPSPDPSEVAA